MIWDHTQHGLNRLLVQASLAPGNQASLKSDLLPTSRTETFQMNFLAVPTVDFNVKFQSSHLFVLMTTTNIRRQAFKLKLTSFNIWSSRSLIKDSSWQPLIYMQMQNVHSTNVAPLRNVVLISMSKSSPNSSASCGWLSCVVTFPTLCLFVPTFHHPFLFLIKKFTCSLAVVYRWIAATLLNSEFQ
jgi:hypothetical protein